MRSSFRKKRTNISNLRQLISQDQQHININSYMSSQSVKSPKLIALDQIPERLDSKSQLKQLKMNKVQREQSYCNRKNCMSSNIQRIRFYHKSSPNVKIFSPTRVDIIIQQKNKKNNKNGSPVIHSTINLNRKYISKSKDLLQEFKQLQQLRKSIKSRKINSRNKVNFLINSTKSYKTVKNEGSKQTNPEKANLYLQVKAKISKRYNQMFKRYSNRSKQLSSQQIDMKDLWSARSLRINKSAQ